MHSCAGRRASPHLLADSHAALAVGRGIASAQACRARVGRPQRGVHTRVAAARDAGCRHACFLWGRCGSKSISLLEYSFTLWVILVIRCCIRKAGRRAYLNRRAAAALPRAHLLQHLPLARHFLSAPRHDLCALARALGLLSGRPWKYIATLAVATASYYWIEKPLVRLGHKLAPPATAGHKDLSDLPTPSR